MIVCGGHDDLIMPPLWLAGLEIELIARTRTTYSGLYGSMDASIVEHGTNYVSLHGEGLRERAPSSPCLHSR
jgi:hypothetical protein